MLTVYGFGSAFGLSDTSPYVVKVETWLRLAKIPYRSERGDLRKAPKGKLPYVADGNRVVADSSQIIEYLEKKYQDPLNDKRFDAWDRALAQVLKSLFEADLYFIVAYLRWWNDDDFEIMRAPVEKMITSAGIPQFAVPAAAALVRRSVRGQIDAQGTGRHAREEVYTMGRNLVESASELLASKKFFLDDYPSRLDATAYGMLASLMADPFDNPVKACAKGRQNLVDYCERVRTLCWPIG